MVRCITGRALATIGMLLAAVLFVLPARGTTARAWADAADALARALKTPPGPARDQLLGESASSYKALLESDPARDPAPEAALNGGFAFRQLGQYGEAIAVYRLFVKAYGDDALLARLAKGDPTATPPTPPDPKRYAERVRYLGMAYEELGTACVVSFDYRLALETFDRVASHARLEPRMRRTAARNAMVLHAVLGEREALMAVRRTFRLLDPSPSDTIETEFLVADFEVKQWDRGAADDGANRKARLAALRAMQGFYDRFKADRSAAEPTARAAARAAALHRAGGDAGQARVWCDRARNAFDKWRALAPNAKADAGATDADWSAACEPAARDLTRGRHVAPPVEAMLPPPPVAAD